MATIDQQFVEYIVKTLVNNPEKVTVDRQIDEKGVLLSLSVDPEDVGRVIGRRGATAQSIRTLLRALGTKNDARYNLKIVNDDAPHAEKSEKTVEETKGTAEPIEEAAPIEEVEEEAVAEEAPAETEAEESDETSDLAERTRAELADYDDLDI